MLADTPTVPSLLGEPLQGPIVDVLSPEAALAASVCPPVDAARRRQVNARLRQLRRQAHGRQVAARRRAGQGPHGRQFPSTPPIPTPGLDDLQIPDDVPGGVHAQPVSGLMRLIARYRPEDLSLIGGTCRQILSEARSITAPRRVLVRRTAMYRAGTRLEALTLFTVADMLGTGDGPPMLWMTRLFQQRPKHRAVSTHSWMYSSRQAAVEGHRMVVAALPSRNSSRARR